MEIALVLFSDLDLGNGGVETWLNLFLNEISNKKEKHQLEKIHIYYLDKLENIDVTFYKHDFVKLHPIKINYKKKGLMFNFFIYFKFHLYSLKNLKQNQKNIKTIVSIGSYPTGIFTWVILNLLFYRKGIRHIIWLRTTLSSFIKTIKSKKITKLIFKLEERALNDADILISNGWDTKKNYISDYGITSIVIPNAINLIKYENSKDLNEIDTPIKVAFIGRFFENKGAFNFVDSIKIFNSKNPHLSSKINFIFVGWGEESVEKFAVDTFNCSLIGKVSNSEIMKILDEIHCGVALTMFNKIQPGGSGVSNGILELMASGKIIIANDNQIYRQFPKENFLCFIKENDNNQLASVYVDIINRKNDYFTRSKNAKKYVESFSIKSHVSSFFKLIKN